MTLGSDLLEVIAHRCFGPISPGHNLDEVRRLVDDDEIFDGNLEPVRFGGITKYMLIDFNDVKFQFRKTPSGAFTLFLISIYPQAEPSRFDGAGVFTFESYGIHCAMRLIDVNKILSRHKLRWCRKDDVSDSTSTYHLAEGVSFIFSHQYKKSAKSIYSIEITSPRPTS